MTSAENCDSGPSSTANGVDHGEHDSELLAIEIWRLPLNFFELPEAEQWREFLRVSVPIHQRRDPKVPCEQPWQEQAVVIAWFLLGLGLPIAMIPLSLAFAVGRWWRSLGTFWMILAALAFQPLPERSLGDRRSRIGMLCARYFTFTILGDRSVELVKHWATPKVDEFPAPLPFVPLACPHGVLNLGAVTWCFFMRWICGREQVTSVASAVRLVPGLRQFTRAIWCTGADRKSIVSELRERGTVAVVPDGIAGIFHAKPGEDVVALGKKRGLMRICLEEGALVGAGYFTGTTEHFTVIHDPFGILKGLSRRLRVSLLLFYGRWGLPVPRRVPVTMIPTVCQAVKNPSPTAEEVEALHQAVYGGLAKAFNQFKEHTSSAGRELTLL